jgi:predicted component of type VI protein secretion system
MPPAASNSKPLGIMKPLGGGDPIPLKKGELIVGRRPTCDIRLDFDRISGKHCLLRMIKGVWHVRDLGSTNGTTVNGQRISSEHGLLPDDEFGIAGYLYMLDYDPIAPTQVMAANQVLEEEISDNRRRHSLMELAGLERETDRDRDRADFARPSRAPERIVRPSSDDGDFDDPIRNQTAAPAPKAVASDDDFFQMIQDAVDTPAQPKKR